MAGTPYVFINIGEKQRKFRVDMNALADMEIAWGADNWKGIDAFLKDIDKSIVRLRIFLWACLRQDEPRLTIDEVGRWIHLGNLEEVLKATEPHKEYINATEEGDLKNPKATDQTPADVGTGPSPSDSPAKPE